MCRWLAYGGPQLSLEELLFKPRNSLIRQSLAATRSIVPTNGDGFGVGWYGALPMPGIFRDTLPAWNDANLRSLSEQITSRLFFAHVRASTGTSTSRENCHPFRRGNLMFMHNGQIGGFSRIRREIEQLIPDELYRDRLGTTDSEAFFLLACGNGLTVDVPGALTKTIGQILRVMDRARVAEPFRMTAAVSDGRSIYALRYSSDAKSPTLYYGTGSTVEIRDDAAVRFTPGDAAVLVLSEPLDESPDGWIDIPEAHILQTAAAARISKLAL
jgi:predicted glutamine amidotransferase